MRLISLPTWRMIRFYGANYKRVSRWVWPKDARRTLDGMLP